MFLTRTHVLVARVGGAGGWRGLLRARTSVAARADSFDLVPSASPSHSAASFDSALPATAADDEDPAGSSDLKRHFSRMAGESRIIGHSELPMT